MSKVVGVRFEKGVLKPLEQVELEEGEEVRVRIEKESEGEAERPYRRP